MSDGRDEHERESGESDGRDDSDGTTDRREVDRDDSTDSHGVSDTTPADQGGSSETESAARIEAYTTDRLSLSPDVRLLWGIKATAVLVLLGVVVGTVLVSVGVHPAFALLVGVTLVVAGAVWVLLHYRRWVYQIRADTIYLERGVFTHVRTLVPYVRIQHVDTSRGPLERTLGLSTLVVYTAGSRGADVSIPGLTPEQARDLQQRVKELAIEAEGDDAL
jgi:hypothetical protein